MLDYDRSRPGYNPVRRESEEASGGNGQEQKSFMDYNFKLFTVFGISVRAHVLLPAFLVLTFVFWWRTISNDLDNLHYWVALVLCYNVILWETVLVHEFGHCLAGYLVGGRSDKIILWPLGGLAFTQPPMGGSTEAKRKASTWIALGGPLTHIPHCFIWAALLIAEGKQTHEGKEFDNAMLRKDTWQETIYTPINSWLWYDVCLMGFAMNFWLFVLNLLLPAFPLDGSKVFVNMLRTVGGFGTNKTAWIYVFTNAILGVGWILFAYTFMKSGSMVQFGGIWAVFQCNAMVQLLISGQETRHPLLIDR